MVTVASYNIRKSLGTDRKRQPGRILEVISEIDADIVALQEVDRRFGAHNSSLAVENILKDTAYEVVRFGVRPTSLGWHGNTILIRKGIEVIAHKRLKLPALEPRGAVLADLRVNGQTLRVIGMHLGLVGLWRVRQARAVLQHLEALEEKLPTVFMGDLNQWTTEGGCLAQFAQTQTSSLPAELPLEPPHLPSTASSPISISTCSRRACTCRRRRGARPTTCRCGQGSGSGILRRRPRAFPDAFPERAGHRRHCVEPRIAAGGASRSSAPARSAAGRPGRASRDRWRGPWRGRGRPRRRGRGAGD